MIPRKPLSNSNSTPKTAHPKVPTSGIRRKELPVNTGIQSPVSTPNIAHRYKALLQTNRRLDKEYDQLSVGNGDNAAAFGSTQDLLAGTKVQTATITSSAAAEELSKVSVSEDPSYVNGSMPIDFKTDAVMTAMTGRKEAETKETALPQLKVLHSIYVSQQQQHPNNTVH